MNALGEYAPYTEKCDMWALGILLYKLCFALFPFPSANLQDRAIAQVLQEIATFEGYEII
jgi:serine/threonine protein kinase